MAKPSPRSQPTARARSSTLTRPKRWSWRGRGETESIGITAHRRSGVPAIVADRRSEEYSHIMTEPVISRDPDIMGGTAVFNGTRVPVQTFVDYLEAGESIDDFLEGFPSVTRNQVIAFLEEAKDRMIKAAS